MREEQAAELDAATSEPVGDADTQPDSDSDEPPPAAASATDAASPPGDASPADSDADDDGLAAARAARQERLAAMRAAREKEREVVDNHQPRPEPNAEKLAELEQLRARMADPKEFFALAKEQGLSPTQLAEYLRESIESPEQVAAKEVEARMAKRVEALEAQLKSAEEARAQAEQEQEVVRLANEFVAMTADQSKVAPHAAAFLREFGPQEYIAYVDQVAAQLGEGVGFQTVHDQVETNLERLARLGVSATKQTQPTTPPAAAAQAPQTITNALAATRNSIGDEDLEQDGPRPTYQERVQRARERARKGLI